MKVSIGVSNRHVHLCEKDLKKLFGDDYKLEIGKEINQPGQYASTAKVSIKTNKAIIENVRILGPTRKYSQVEISMTDAYKLGLNPPVRESGDLAHSAPITIVGPLAEINLENGCIIADRHIHITKEEAIEKGLEKVKTVSVKVEGEKGGILENVKIKISEEAYFELHIDTDDANAHLIKSGDFGTIIYE